MKRQSRESPELSEAKFFHYVAVGMGSVLLALLAWIGTNVAQIPVINTEIRQLKEMISNVVTKQLDDHELRIRDLEQFKEAKKH